MPANANALRAGAKISGRHYITFRIPKHWSLEKSTSKTRKTTFLPSRISTLLGKFGLTTSSNRCGISDNMDMRRQRGGGHNPSSGLAATFSPDDRGEGTRMPIRRAGDAGRFRRLDILVRRTTVVFPLVFSTSNNRAKLQESNNVFH